MASVHKNIPEEENYEDDPDFDVMEDIDISPDLAANNDNIAEEHNDIDEIKAGYTGEVPVNVVVLNGTVFSAHDLPNLSSDELDGRAFFRVLYVEGGSNSTMFRCKTTVFKSDIVENLYSPIWRDRLEDDSFFNGTFRFEMHIPDGYKTRSAILAKSKLSDADKNKENSPVDGEILIAVYRARAQGGNDFVGQVNIN